MLICLPLLNNATRSNHDKEVLVDQSPKTDTRSPSSVPWDNWELDKKFFKALSRWTLDHPETTVSRVLDNVCNGLENGKELLGLIPDSPFPARGLVGALGHLVKLGVTISAAKKEVQTFAKQIIHWVGELQAVFSSAADGQLTRSAWRKLSHMRSLIDEICKWAVARLKDRRWSRVGHGLIIQKEITEFKTRLAEAQELFRDLSVIDTMKGLDGMKRRLRALLHGQNVITQEIKKIRKTQAQQLNSIIDGLEAQKQAEARRLFLSQTLSPRTVANPTYDHQGKQPCDQDTRIGVLADIAKWVKVISNGSQNFLWLTGDPGCGKSAITASTARSCKDQGILWAQFFINRNNVDTTDPNSFFPSIARQLADRSPEIEQVIHDTLKQKPSLMDGISAEQAAKLFLDAVSAAARLNPKKPVVIVIDGLDETDRRYLRDTAVIFAALFQGLSSYPNAKVFISSRTEDDIRNPFARTMHNKNVKHIHLDTSAPSSIEDVSSFLRRKVVNIVEINDLNWTEWPGDERMAILAMRASGLFIWAVTVAKFLQEQIDTVGTECLNDVLDLLSAEAMGDINTLYSIILRLTYKDQAGDWEFEKFRRIVGAISVLREPLSLDDLSQILELRRSPQSLLADVPKFVRRLRTVLVAGADAIDGKTVTRLHKSFFEFITSEHVDLRFRVDTQSANGELASNCLRLLTNTSGVVTESKAPIPSPLRYALRYWTSYLPQIDGMTAGVALSNTNISLPKLQQMLQFSYSRNRLLSGPLNVTFSSHGSQITTSIDNQVRVWDAITGNYIREHGALKTLVNRMNEPVYSVHFSPDGKRIASTFETTAFTIWSCEKDNDTEIHLIGHVKSVRSVAFSSDGKHVVSGSDDYTVCIWDAESGQRIGSPLLGHTGGVRSVVFSTTGKQIVSGSEDHTLRIWNTENGKSVGFPLQGHAGGVYAVATYSSIASRNPSFIASGSEDATVRLWDPHSGEQLGHPLRGHTAPVNSIAISHNGARLVSGSDDRTIRLWNVESCRQVGQAFTGHTSAVLSVAFAPNGRMIASGARDAFVHLWYIDDNGLADATPRTLSGHTDAVSSIAFSPDGKTLVSGSADRAVRFWGVPPERKAFDDYLVETFTAFSPDGSQVVAYNHLYEILRFWDVRLDHHAEGLLEQALHGRAENTVAIAFSPDGSRIAAVSSMGDVHLWSAATRRLIAATFSGDLTLKLDRRTTSLYFSTSNRLILASGDETIRIFENMNGKLVDSGKYDSLTAHENPWRLLIEDGTPISTMNDGRLRWYPSAKTEFGVWAYVDQHIIRGRKDGSVTIVPVEGI